jgi:predicted HAD superfamily hydrolase
MVFCYLIKSDPWWIVGTCTTRTCILALMIPDTYNTGFFISSEEMLTKNSEYRIYKHILRQVARQIFCGVKNQNRHIIMAMTSCGGTCFVRSSVFLTKKDDVC